MNGLGINNASKNDKDTTILTLEEVAFLRTHASDGTLTAEERETYSKHLEAMKKLVPEEVISGTRKGKKEGELYRLGVAEILVTVALILLATITVINLIQTANGARTRAEFTYPLELEQQESSEWGASGGKQTIEDLGNGTILFLPVWDYSYLPERIQELCDYWYGECGEKILLEEGGS